MRRFFFFIAAGLLFLAPGCELDGQPSREEAEKAELAIQAAVDQARDAGEALSAGQEHVFRPTADQAAYLESFTAINALGTVNGFFTNQDGISGYFRGYDRPFNFLWTGGTVEVTAFDGRTHRVINGPGELLLKYHDDALLLQRSKGEFKEGLWHGYGELWTRNRQAGGHNYRYYRGGFANDQMSGRGILVNYNFSGLGDHPRKYEGDMEEGLFHGQGVLTDLATGEMVYKGLWLEGRRFAGSPDDWRAGVEWGELHTVERQYYNVLMTDELLLDGFINIKAGEGALIVAAPEAFENVTVADQSGRLYPVGAFPPFKEGGRSDGPEVAVDGEAAVLDLPQSEYPLTLTVSYDRGSKRHYLQVTVKRPFGLGLNGGGLVDQRETVAPDPTVLEPDELERQIEDTLRQMETTAGSDARPVSD